MASIKPVYDEMNPTLAKIIKRLKDMKVDIRYPIIVNTSNDEPDKVWISCNYMGTGLKMDINEIDFNDFNNINPDKMKHYSTWTYIPKTKMKKTEKQNN